MAEFLARRLLHALLTLVGISLLVFMLVHALPGEPVDYYRAQVARADATVLEAMRRAYQLDQPVAVQYVSWLSRTVRGDLGSSYVDHEPVLAKIRERLSATAWLNITALLFSFSTAVPLGIALSLHRRAGEAGETVLLLLFSVPLFWLALLLIYWFVMRIPIFPLFGSESMAAEQLPFVDRLFDRLRHMVLPVVCLSAAPVAMIARVTRSSVDEAMLAEHIVAARARGLSDGAVRFRHAFRVALVPLVSVVGVIIPFALSGSVVVERIFQWRGLGDLLFDSILTRDYPVVVGLTLFNAVIVLASSIAVDVLYTWADPRIRVGERND